MEDLAGKVAVVTGAASGIGFGLAERFVDEGMKVVLADVEQAALDRAAEELASRGGEVLAVATDVSDAVAVDALASATVERFGTYHVVCNNAGVGGAAAPSWKAPEEVWRWVIEVNLWGVINGIRAFVPRLVEQNSGHVVNTASMAAFGPFPYDAPYAASKHAVLGLSRSLSMELSMRGSEVGVTVLCPGFVRTGIADSGRNWPARLGPAPDPIELAGPVEAFWDLFRKMIDEGAPPSALAELTVDAIRARRFLVLTDEAMAQAALEGAAGEVAGRDPGYPGLG